MEITEEFKKADWDLERHGFFCNWKPWRTHFHRLFSGIISNAVAMLAVKCHKCEFWIACLFCFYYYCYSSPLCFCCLLRCWWFHLRSLVLWQTATLPRCTNHPKIILLGAQFLSDQRLFQVRVCFVNVIAFFLSSSLQFLKPMVGPL